MKLWSFKNIGDDYGYIEWIEIIECIASSKGQINGRR